MIGLFNDCFPPIMDGVSLTTQNYAYWLHKKAGNVCVVTPKTPAAKDKEAYPVYRYSSVPIPMRKPYRLGFPRIDWPFHERILWVWLCSMATVFGVRSSSAYSTQA